MSAKTTDLFTKSDIAAVLLLSALVLVGGILAIYEKSRAVIYPEVVVETLSPSIVPEKNSDALPGTVTAEMLAKNKININTAPLDSLALLPGIGPLLSKRIVDHRSQRGRFGEVDDLLQVSGIGSARLAAVRDMITVGDE